jgi:hypothetical protein
MLLDVGIREFRKCLRGPPLIVVRLFRAGIFMLTDVITAIEKAR